MILVPLFDLKFLERTRGRWCRNFKSAALEVLCEHDLTSEITPFGNPPISQIEALGSRSCVCAQPCHAMARSARSVVEVREGWGPRFVQAGLEAALRR